MFDILKKYRHQGVFVFKPFQLFREECNAPNDQSGVYIIFKIVNEKEILIYIGASGQKKRDGTLKHRKGGLKDRLINGYHPNRFGQLKRMPRYKAIPQQMQNEGISELKIYWWVTYDHEKSDFPTNVETILRDKYFEENNELPCWHQRLASK